jgi:hypothetical protein
MKRTASVGQSLTESSAHRRIHPMTDGAAYKVHWRPLWSDFSSISVIGFESRPADMSASMGPEKKKSSGQRARLVHSCFISLCAASLDLHDVCLHVYFEQNTSSCLEFVWFSNEKKKSCSSCSDCRNQVHGNTSPMSFCSLFFACRSSCHPISVYSSKIVFSGVDHLSYWFCESKMALKYFAVSLHSKEDWIWFSIPESCSMEWPSGGHILVIFQLRSFHFQSRRNRLIRLTGDTADSGTDSLTRTFFSPPRPVDVNCRRPLTSHPSPTSSDGRVNKKNGFFFLAESIITKLLIDY